MTLLSAAARLSMGVSIVAAFAVAADIVLGRWQKMAIMNIVWPLTMLYAGILGVGAYLWFGRADRRIGKHKHGDSEPQRPFWQSVVLGTTHCGSGCTLGDLVSESITVAFPLTLFGQDLFGGWVLDFVVAFAFGIAFQYWAIQPMRHLPALEGLKAALKADALSLTAWQVGMYGWMALVVFVIFGQPIPKSDPTFWFMMQIAMLVGFVTSLPVNAWLIRTGRKERM